mmetsp:Transcript_16612/g.29081  ORF Transcript_16612/g.29081 Transcript_16612/m.29081 type:complete len:343 (-) Transcript_16612:42-1070(-)
MFMDVCLSNLGKATQVQMMGMQKQLGMKSDPCLPASDAAQLKPVKTLPDPALFSASQSDLSNLYSALSKPKKGQLGQVSKASSGTWPRSAAIMEERVMREKSRSSSSFKNVGRQELEMREAKEAIVPPVGTYNPKDDCTASLSRVKHPAVQSHSFGLREPTRSLKAKEDDRGRELPESGIVENTLARRRHIVHVDIAKQTGRPDIVKAANIVINDPVALSTVGFMYGHERCAKYGKHYRQPCFDFARQSTAKQKPPDSYTQPGEYDVRPGLAYLRPRLGQNNLPFESRPSRRDIHEGLERPGDHLPDRSLARGSPILTNLSRMKSPSAPVPDFSRAISRPSV